MARVHALHAIVATACLSALPSCQSLEKPPPPPIQVKISVESDPGHALPGASVWRETRELGATGVDGSVVVPLRGQDGDSVDLTVRCPQNEYLSPQKPISVVLRRTLDQKVTEYRTACPPLYRNIVVAVRAENGPGLPIFHLNQFRGRTDASGAAHFTLRSKPGESVEVQILTRNEKAGEGLSPKDPTKTFIIKSQDEVLLFDQKFDVEKKKVIVVGPRLPGRI